MNYLQRCNYNQANYDLAKRQLSFTRLVAPFDGVIGNVFKESFESVNPGEPVFEIHRNDVVHVKVQLPNSIVAQFEVEPEDYHYQPSVTFLGHSERYAMSYLEHTSELLPHRQVYEVWLTMPQVAPEILPGVSASIEVNLAEASLGHKRGYRVPLSVLDAAESPDSFYVWKYFDTGVQKGAVTVDQVGNNGALVTQGIDEGDILVSTSIRKMRNNLKVVLSDEAEKR